MANEYYHFDTRNYLLVNQLFANFAIRESFICQILFNDESVEFSITNCG